MRVLYTCLPGFGHFNPMVPVARAAAAAGHQVAFATASDFCSRVEAVGFRAFPAGLGMSDQMAEARRRFPAQAALPPGPERFAAFVPRMLAGVAAEPRATDLMGVVRRWQPDLIVHDVADFGGILAAVAAGIPYADHSVGLLRPLAASKLAGQVLRPIADRWDVDLGPFGGLFRYLYLDVCPAGLQTSEIQEVPVAHPLQNVRGLDGAPGDELPSWIATLPERPTVYATLGTLFNGDLAVFEVIIAGLATLPVNVIVTVGPSNDPAAFGPLPDNVHVERYLPLSLLLPHLDAVVTQGGTSILPALAYGLPLLVLPRGADQFNHAQACVDAGAARRLMPDQVTPEAVRREVQALLDGPDQRRHARWLAEQIAAMPGPKYAVRLLERLNRDRRPLWNTELCADVAWPGPEFLSLQHL